MSDASIKYGNVQFPVGTPIDPTRAVRPPGALKSYEFIARFTAKDTNPVPVTDDASQALRNAQIVQITKGIVGEATQGASDEQILNLHRDYVAGRY